MEQDVFIPEKDDVIQDPVLHWAVRSAMNNISSRDKLTAEDVGSEYVKYISFEQSNHPENFVDWEMPWVVESLEGLQHAKSAIQIDIGYTTSDPGKKLKSLKPISGLTQLRQLFLKYDGLTDISDISGLTNLTELWLDNNEISDATPIRNMKNLSRLSLSGNKIEDIESLMSLESARTIDLSRNNIKTLPEDMSGLKNLMSLDLSSNTELTDISSLRKINSLQRISLLSCNNITDIKPLAELTALNKEETYLPSRFDNDKDDLFVAIDVNKSIRAFSISNMTAADLTNVKKALDAYDALSDKQKAYLDENKIKAVRDNYNKVKNGEEPDAYPEYEKDGAKVPVWDRIEIKVVNQSGAPMAEMQFVKDKKTEYVSDKNEIKTDENGMLILKHTMLDANYTEILIYPKDRSDITPDQISYSVGWGMEGGPIRNTLTVNGKKATGTESLQFVVKEADFDKSLEALENLVNKVEDTAEENESFRYTKDSWEAYEADLQKAKNIIKSKLGTVAEIQKITNDLQKSFDSLKKSDKLTTIKLTVRDKEGKHIGRKFKFLVRDTNNHNRSWNEWSDAENGVAYIKATPGWSDDTTWEIISCTQETLDMEPITVTTCKEGSKWYFKTINGKDASIDFEKIATVWPKNDGSGNKPGGGETPAPGPGGGGGGSTPAPGGGSGGAAPEVPSKDPITNNKYNGNVSTDINLSDKANAVDDKADVKVDKDLADKVVENAVANKSDSVNINATTSAGDAAKTEFTLPADTFRDLAGKTDVNKITVKTDNGSVSMDRDAVIAVAEQAGSAAEVKLVVETKESAEDKVVIELKVVTSNGEIHDFKGGKVTVTVPVKNTSGKALVAVYIDDNGKYTKIGGKLTDAGFVFETGHFSQYAVMTEETADAAIKAQEKAEAPSVKVAKASVKLKAYKGGKLKVTASAKNATGYRVYYKKSTWKKYKTYTKGNVKTLNKTFKKLSKGKYTVKVKAYHKTANGNVTWGAISNARTARVK